MTNPARILRHVKLSVLVVGFLTIYTFPGIFMVFDFGPGRRRETWSDRTTWSVWSGLEHT